MGRIEAHLGVVNIWAFWLQPASNRQDNTNYLIHPGKKEISKAEGVNSLL